MATHRFRFVQVVLSEVLFFRTSSASVDLDACQQIVQRLIAANATLANDPYYFAVTPADVNNLVLTPEACQEWCPNNPPTLQCASRLFQWVIPAVLLVGAMQTPAGGWRTRMWAMIRPISSQFDCLCSMWHILKSYAQCYEDAHRICFGSRTSVVTSTAATIRQQRRKNSGLREVVPPQVVEGDPTKDLAVILSAIRYLSRPEDVLRLRDFLILDDPVAQSANRYFTLFHSTACEIMDNRNREVWRAYGAVVVAIANVLFSMASALAPGAAPLSGATIIPFLALSLLLLVTMLSNAIGEPKSLHTLQDKVVKFLDQLAQLRQIDLTYEKGQSVKEAIQTLSPEDLDQLRYTSGFLFYQPRKGWNMFERCTVWEGVLLVILLSAVAISLAGAMGAIAAPPTFFNDRNIMVLAILFPWAMSPTCTGLVWLLIAPIYLALDKLPTPLWLRPPTPKPSWEAALIAKDFCIAMYFVIILSGITCGMEGDCKMWSDYYGLGPGDACVYLNNTDTFNWNTRFLYQLLVGVCIGWNVCVFWLVRYIGYVPRLFAAGLVRSHSRGTIADAFHVLAWRDWEIKNGLPRPSIAGQQEGSA